MVAVEVVAVDSAEEIEAEDLVEAASAVAEVAEAAAAVVDMAVDAEAEGIVEVVVQWAEVVEMVEDHGRIKLMYVNSTG